MKAKQPQLLLLVSFCAAATSGFQVGGPLIVSRGNINSPKPPTTQPKTCRRMSDGCVDDDNNVVVSRRSLLVNSLTFAGALANVDPHFSSSPANAMGLVHFPCPPGTLQNTYHMMRAGQSGLEAEGILSTNPLFLTNREDALTDLGTIQVEDACEMMLGRGINPSVVKYSLASKCIDSANIVATKMFVGRNRIIPEFTFMGELHCFFHHVDV